MITKIGAIIAKEDSELRGKDLASAGAGALVAKKSLDHGLHRVFGLRGETHTTGKANAKAIREGGHYLDPAMGGTGASQMSTEFTNASKNSVHITGYNSASTGRGPMKTHINLKQPFYKKLQRRLYAAASQEGFGEAVQANGWGDPSKMKKVFAKSIIPGNSKTFHVMGTEDFYNTLTPDLDDIALKSTKRLKVAPSKLRATLQGIRRYGLSGLKSSPIGRPLIGAGILAGGGYGAYKLMQPAAHKLLSAQENS